MTKQIGIYNHITGENTVREMTSAEIATYEAEATEQAAAKAAALAEKEAAKTALLNTLGITEAQAITLGFLPAVSNPIPVAHLTEISTPEQSGTLE